MSENGNRHPEKWMGFPGMKKSWLCLAIAFALSILVLPVLSRSEKKAAAAEIITEMDVPEEWSKENWEAWSVIVQNNNIDLWVKYEEIETSSLWFKAFKLPGNVIAIAEPGHEQFAIAFLIPGDEKAILLDTCTGFQNIREVVDQLTDLPVTVLNSHDHFAHIGGNSAFEDVWCYNLPSAISHLTQGPTEKELAEILDPSKTIMPLVWLHDLEVPETIPGKAPTGTVEDGQVIDLGGRKLEVIHTPGHQPSCIMLLDRENRLLFTGDMFYPEAMLCQFDDSSFPDYVKSIRKAADLAVEVGVEMVYTSHVYPAEETATLCAFADFLEKMDRGEVEASESEDGFSTYSMDDKISIILTEEGAEPMSIYNSTGECR